MRFVQLVCVGGLDNFRSRMGKGGKIRRVGVIKSS